MLPRTIRFIAGLGVLAACSSELGLPSPPVPPDDTPSPPAVTSFAPLAAHAGMLLHVEGEHFRGPADALSVRFGDVTVRAESVTDDARALTVRVPEDAGSGPLRVSSAAGEGVSAGSFTYLGAGRLRRAQITADKDLRTNVEAILLPVGQGTIALSWEYGTALVVTPDGRQEPLPLGQVLAMAPSPDGRVMLVEERADLPGCRQRLVFATGTTLGDTYCLPLRPGETTPDELASDDTGTHVLLTNGGAAILVDLTGPAPTAVRFDAPFGGTRSPVFLGSRRFAFAEWTSLRTFDASGSVGAAFDVPDPLVGERAYVSAHGNQLVSSTSEGLLFFDATAWPPVRTGRAETFGRFGSVAYSADGTRVLLADIMGDSLYVVDTAGPRTIARVDVELAVRPRAARDGTFIVGVRGGWAILAQQSGTLLTKERLGLGLGHPQLSSTTIVPDGEAPIVLATTRVMGGIVSFERLRLGYTSAISAERYDAVAGAAGSPAVFARRGTKLIRIDLPEQPTFEFADGLWVDEPTLELSPDGRFLLLTWVRPDGEGQVALVGVDGFPNAAGALVPFDEPVLTARLDPTSSRLAVVSRHLIRIWEVAPFLAREPDVLRTNLVTENDLVAADAGPDVLVFLSRSATGEILFDFVGFDGSVSPTAERPAGARISTEFGEPTLPAFVVGPGGRRVYWITGVGADRELVTVVLDPENRRAVRAEPSIALSPRASGLLAYPDGEGLLVHDPVNDRMQLVQ